MGWRHDRWPAYQPRPKLARLSKDALRRIEVAAREFVQGSPVLRELVSRVECARGRVYVWRGPDDLMARLTPLSSRTLLLETPRGAAWTGHGRGALLPMMEFVERDQEGTFHGLGSLVGGGAGKRSVQQALHEEFGVPIPVLAEPRHWYSMHRRPRIIETDRERGRVLVRFEARSWSGEPIRGTCLYASVDGRWGCYTIRPNASASIAAAEEWLRKRSWEEWG